MMDKLFSVHMDKMSALKLLSDKQIGHVIRMLIEYQETGENKNSPDTPSVGFAFEILKQSLDALNETRNNFSDAQKKRVEKRWEKKMSDKTKDTPVSPGNTGEYRAIPIKRKKRRRRLI